MNIKTMNLLAFWAAIACVALLCVLVQSNYLVNGNISWLLMGAERLLMGQSMSQHVYESNPPMSLIIYFPHVLLGWLTKWPLPIASFYVTGLEIIISTLATHAIIKRFDFLKKEQHLAFIACYTISITLITTVFFSEREHFIILGLAPFMLCQFALMENIKLPKALMYVVFAIGAVCILIKPHYGLVPAVFLLTRLIKHKSINFLKEPDFIALSSTVLLYVGVIFIIFPDFINIIFPNIINYYLPSGKEFVITLGATKLYTLIYICAYFLEVFQTDLKKKEKAFVLFIYACCLLCMVPYYVQLKGFYNHLIPAYSFFVMGLSLSIILRLKKIKGKLSSLQIIIPFVLVLFVISNISPLNNNFATHKDLEQFPATAFLEKECEKPCTFFAFHGDVEIFNPTAALMGYTVGTRFSGMWFFSQLLINLESKDPLPLAQAKQDLEKTYKMVTEDLEHYEPSILLIAKDLKVETQDKFDFISFFSKHPPFKHIIKEHYEKTGILKFDRGLYFKGTSLKDEFILDFDIYKRRN